VTINEIHNEYEPPLSLQKQWFARSYHGSVEHNSRAVINRYLGYWDGNPATLIPLSPRDSAPLYVEMMGGSDPILAKGQQLYDQGRYLEAQEIVNKLVYAEPESKEGKNLLADIFEQIGYQQESSSVRNSFLAGAYELRSGIPEGVPGATSGPDLLRALSTEMFFDYLAIRLDSTKVENVEFVANLYHPDTEERLVLELSNATLTTQPGFEAVEPTVTVTIARADLEDVMLGTVTFAEQITVGKATVEGDTSNLVSLFEALIDFDLLFEMMPGTAQTDRP
jgi:alkyl sulfatase BDS1-like metallo-beta-lactamase superfamily hydrolase